MKNSILRIVIVTALVLSVPLIAMQFTEEVDWDETDFIVIGTLLVVVGLIYEFGVRKIHNVNYRIIAGLTLFAVLFLIWAELAVGIFGTPFAGS